MERNKKWSKEEEKVLLDCVRECDNVSEGLQKASKDLNRSYTACLFRYEYHIPKNKKIKDTGKRRKYTRWNEEKDKYILDYIGKHPNNLHLSFEHIADKYGTTPNAVSNRYYTVLKKSPSYVFTTIGKKTQSPNTKNIPYDSSDKPKRHSIWSKLKKLLKI